MPRASICKPRRELFLLLAASNCAATGSDARRQPRGNAPSTFGDLHRRCRRSAAAALVGRRLFFDAANTRSVAFAATAAAIQRARQAPVCALERRERTFAARRVVAGGARAALRFAVSRRLRRAFRVASGGRSPGGRSYGETRRAKLRPPRSTRFVVSVVGKSRVSTPRAKLWAAKRDLAREKMLVLSPAAPSAANFID